MKLRCNELLNISLQIGHKDFSSIQYSSCICSYGSPNIWCDFIWVHLELVSSTNGGPQWDHPTLPNHFGRREHFKWIHPQLHHHQSEGGESNPSILQLHITSVCRYSELWALFYSCHYNYTRRWWVIVNSLTLYLTYRYYALTYCNIYIIPIQFPVALHKTFKYLPCHPLLLKSHGNLHHSMKLMASS